MDDIIFERDYREAESGEYDEWCDEVFDRAVNGGMLKAYSDAMDKIPKIIIPEDKKNYEYLLERCDAFVERHRGRIEGIVDYHHWHSLKHKGFQGRAGHQALAAWVEELGL